MSCSCIYPESVQVLDGLAPFDWKELTTIKTTTYCGECGTKMPPGTLFKRQYSGASKCDTCLGCHAVALSIFCTKHVYGCLWQDIYFHLLQYPDWLPVDAIAKLPKQTRDKLCDLIESVGGWYDLRRPPASVTRTDDANLKSLIILPGYKE